MNDSSPRYAKESDPDIKGCDVGVETGARALSPDPVLIRQVAPGDLAYLFSTWLRDLRDADPSGLPDDLWFPPHREHLERTLADRRTVALVACASDQPSEILGYVVAEPKEVLQWIHVRKGLRGRGLAKRLLNEADVPPGTPSLWQTSLGRARLRNPCRSRLLRRRPAPSAESGSPSSPR